MTRPRNRPEKPMAKRSWEQRQKSNIFDAFRSERASIDAVSDLIDVGTKPNGRGQPMVGAAGCVSMNGTHSDQPTKLPTTPYIPPFSSMLPTIRALECLTWQLVYESSPIVFDESRWQECFKIFNLLAMQSTSLITMLAKKYEEKQMFEKIADALLCNFQSQIHQHQRESFNLHREASETSSIGRLKQYQNEKPGPDLPIAHPPTRMGGSADPDAHGLGILKPSGMGKKRSKKDTLYLSKENSRMDNNQTSQVKEEREKMDDEQLAWSLHLELNTKPRSGKPRHSTTNNLRTCLSLPCANQMDHCIPESRSRRKQSKRAIRRSL